MHDGKQSAKPPHSLIGSYMYIVVKNQIVNYIVTDIVVVKYQIVNSLAVTGIYSGQIPDS